MREEQLWSSWSSSCGFNWPKGDQDYRRQVNHGRGQANYYNSCRQTISHTHTQPERKQTNKRKKNCRCSRLERISSFKVKFNCSARATFEAIKLNAATRAHKLASVQLEGREVTTINQMSLRRRPRRRRRLGLRRHSDLSEASQTPRTVIMSTGVDGVGGAKAQLVEQNNYKLFLFGIRWGCLFFFYLSGRRPSTVGRCSWRRAKVNLHLKTD